MTNKILIILSILLNITLVQAYPTIPNSQETTGELCNVRDLDFTEYRYQEQIPYCIRNVDVSLKQLIYNRYNIPVECRHRYTIDHFIPLSIGGNNNIKNLWPEHKLVKATRPKLELELYQKIRDSLITQKAAIQVIVKAKTSITAVAFSADKTTTLDKCDTLIIAFQD